MLCFLLWDKLKEEANYKLCYNINIRIIFEHFMISCIKEVSYQSYFSNNSSFEALWTLSESADLRYLKQQQSLS